MSENRAATANLAAQAAELAVQVEELADAQVVPRVRSELELCAGGAALLLVSRNDSAALLQCTAVPMPRELLAHDPPSNSSLFFLTSAHCFFSRDKAWEKFAWLASIFRSNTTYSCRLVSSLGRLHDEQVLDLAVVACSMALPVAPTALSLLPHAASHEAVAMAGFLRGWHGDPSKEVWAEIWGTSARYALHSRITRLSSSLQLLVPANASEALLPGAGLVAAGSVRSPPPSGSGSVRGFLLDRPEQGMSGGPVLDVRCGLLGIIELQSQHGQGGAYVRLGGPRVQRWVAEAIANATLGWEVTVN